MTKFTHRQLAVLHSLDKKEFRFPRGPEVMICERLERMGLAEGQLEPAVWDSRRGITKYIRAYRKSKSGVFVCKRNPIDAALQLAKGDG